MYVRLFVSKLNFRKLIVELFHKGSRLITESPDDQAPEDSTGAPEQMSSTRGMFPLGPVPEQPF